MGVSNEPTASEIFKAKQEFLTEFYNIWGDRKLPLEILRFEVFKRILKENPNYCYTATRLKVLKEI